MQLNRLKKSTVRGLKHQKLSLKIRTRRLENNRNKKRAREEDDDPDEPEYGAGMF